MDGRDALRISCFYTVSPPAGLPLDLVAGEGAARPQPEGAQRLAESVPDISAGAVAPLSSGDSRRIRYFTVLLTCPEIVGKLLRASFRRLLPPAPPEAFRPASGAIT
jgi:hypothetical protein